MRDYEALVRDPQTAPFQYLHAGSTDHENYAFEDVPIPESADHSRHDDALERMLPRHLGPALDVFDAFLSGRADPAAGPRVRWHLPHVGWQESPTWPPPGATELRLFLADADRAPGAPPGGSLAAERGPGSEAVWTHDPGDLVPSTLVDPFSAPYEYPDERSIASRPDVMVFWVEEVVHDPRGDALAEVDLGQTGSPQAVRRPLT
jgi:predicted acyl esterase